MSPMGQIETQDGIPWLETGMVHRGIGLGAGMRLYIGIGRPKEFLGPVNGQLFHLIHHFASPIITFSGIAFRIFVGQNRTRGLHDLWTCKVFRSDEFDALYLPGPLLFDKFKNTVVSLHLPKFLISPKITNRLGIFVQNLGNSPKWPKRIGTRSFGPWSLG